jgi:hypothetical protein
VQESLHQVPTPLSIAFFSRKNVDALQHALVASVQASVGMTVDRQSDWQMLLVMRQTYLAEASNWPDDVQKEVDRLNGRVLTQALAAVSKNLTLFMTYQSRLAMPESLPSPGDSLRNTPYSVSTPVPPKNLNKDGFQALPVSKTLHLPREIPSRAYLASYGVDL